MKKLLLAFSLIGTIVGVNAQSTTTTEASQPMPHHMHMMREKMFDPAEHAARLQKTLQLSDEQTAKVKKIFEDNAQQRKALQDKYKPQLDAFHGDMKKLHEQTHTQLNGILTPKQQQALDAMHKHDGKPGEHEHREPSSAK
jgi:Spy/CpxP family protein refolding chaperone